MKLWHPKQWPSWLLVALLWLLSKLPYRWQIKIGSGLGLLVFKLLKSRARIAQVNIEKCFPDWSAEKKQRLLKESFKALGIGVFESAMAWWSSDRRVKKLISLAGLEQFEQQSAGKGALLLSYHNTMAELAGRRICMAHPGYIFYKRQHNPVIDYVSVRGRLKYAKGVIGYKDMRKMLKCLKQGETVFYLPDHDFGERGSVFAPFFAEANAATLTITSRIVEKTGVKLFPLLGGHDLTTAKLIVEIYPPINQIPTGDDQQDAALINRALEYSIAQFPEQYMWLHRRFKTRPQGEKSYY